MNTITDTLEFILQSIVSPSESITINTQDRNDFTSLEIHAESSIIGQIIGKQGKIIKAIRQILNLSYPNTKYSLEIIEPKAQTD
jgi:predicted RNA-binding protein YlqC (UPF0109 family)